MLMVANWSENLSDLSTCAWVVVCFRDIFGLFMTITDSRTNYFLLATAHLIRISVNFARLLGSCFVRTDAYSATGVAQIIYQSERFYTEAVAPLVHALNIGRFRPPAPPAPGSARVNVCVEEPRNACGGSSRLGDESMPLPTATFYYWSFGGLKRSEVYSNDPIERIGPDDTWRFSSQRTRPRNASAFMHRNNDRASRGLTDRPDLEVEPWPDAKSRARSRPGQH
jgi:hypothetical protein